MESSGRVSSTMPPREKLEIQSLSMQRSNYQSPVAGNSCVRLGGPCCGSHYAFCTVLFLIRPRSKGWPHHGHTFSIMHYVKNTNSSLVVIAFPVSWLGVPVLWWYWHWKTDVKGPTSLRQESGSGRRKVEARLELVFCVPIICDVGGWQEGHLALEISITLIPKGSLPEWLMACGLYWGWERSCSYSLCCETFAREMWK